MGKGLSLRKRRTSAEISGDNGQEQVKQNVSGWYYADITAAIAVFIGLGATWAGMAYYVICHVSVAAFVIAVTVNLCKKLYCKKPPKPLRIFLGVVRGVLYSVGAASLAVPVIMMSDAPVLFPLQQAIYRENYSDRGERIFHFLPDKIPKNAADYKIRMVPAILQGEPYIQIEFFTDNAQLDSYREYAESCGAVRETPADSWKEYLTEKTSSSEAEAWKFPADGYTPYYYICPESGYFMITW